MQPGARTDVSFELLQGVVVLHVEQLDGHFSVPVALIDDPEPAAADHLPQTHLLERDVPLAQGELRGGGEVTGETNAKLAVTLGEPNQ